MADRKVPKKSTKQTDERPRKAKELEKASCVKIRSQVDAELAKRCGAKANRLSKCNSCEITNPDWVVLESPFDASRINTGHDGAGGIIPSGSGTDLHWEVGIGTAANLPAAGAWIPAFVIRNSAWVSSPFANANWISFYADSDHSGKSVDAYFRHQFYLNSALDPSEFVLDMEFYADNSVHEIFINGVRQSQYSSALPQTSGNEYQHRGFDAGAAVRIELANDWQPCANEIIVHVKSGPKKMGFLAQNASICTEAPLPDLSPQLQISWGDSDCDCIETDDLETMCLTVCNPYSNVVFNNFTIGRIIAVDASGRTVPLLPDGTESVQVTPVGPYCFGDIGSCDGSNEHDNCVSREFTFRTRGAKAGAYKLAIEGMCFDVRHHFDLDDCFEVVLCKD